MSVAVGDFACPINSKPRGDKTRANWMVNTYNNVIRGIGQARQVPFLDLHLALDALQAQVNVLSSNMTAVDNLAQAVALGTAASEGGALSPEQAAQLLRLAEGSSADACEFLVADAGQSEPQPRQNVDRCVDYQLTHANLTSPLPMP